MAVVLVTKLSYCFRIKQVLGDTFIIMVINFEGPDHYSPLLCGRANRTQEHHRIYFCVTALH